MSSDPVVLIVDDEPRNQRIVSETLEGHYPVTLAATGEEAMAFLEKSSPDLVLLDIMMPGMDGYEVCRRIRGNPRLAYTKVVLVSGRAMLEERLKGYEAGADDYMTKPFIPEELLAKAKVFVRLAQMERELSESNKSLGKKVSDAEAKIVETAKMSALGEMAGGIAHEINTPLATLLLISEYNEEKFARSQVSVEALKNDFTIIKGAVRKISSIIKGLQFFARDSAGDPFVAAELRQICADTLLLCSERFKKKGIDLRIEECGAELRCRPGQIGQIFLNLLNNAQDAVENLAERWIRVVLSEDASSVTIEVSNSGPPIPEPVRDKVFQPFFTTKEVGTATGLGLSVCQGIAKSHGGSIHLDTSSPHPRFIVNLPKSQPGM